jgi:hypothetical protein
MAYFSWGVACDGYRWCDACEVTEGDGRSTRARFLTPGFTFAWRRYRPLEGTPVLFRTFGEVLPTEEGIQGFASQYGTLGVHKLIAMPNEQHALGECFETWCQEIGAMQHAICVWDALKHKDADALHVCFAQEDPSLPAPVVTLNFERSSTPWPWEVETLRATAQFRQEEWREELAFRHAGPGIPRDDPGYALVWLRALVNSHLADYTGMRLDSVPERAPGLSMALEMVPTNLLGVLWLQLARAIESDPRDQRCPQCQAWFRAPAKARRSSTTYCSPRCRMRASRERLA